jgi:hypothetical protein
MAGWLAAMAAAASVPELAGLSSAGLSGRAAGLDLFKGLAAAREFADDGFDRCRPDKWFGFLVPGSEKVVNGRDPVVDA